MDGLEWLTSEQASKRASRRENMNITYLQKEIIKALKINSNYDWDFGDPNKEFKDLIKFVEKLFKEYKEE